MGGSGADIHNPHIAVAFRFMTHRQIRATFAVAAVIAVVAVVSVVAGVGHDSAAPVEVGVIEPEPLHGDTALSPRSDGRDAVRGKKREKKSRDAEPDHSDSPLKHKTSRDDLAPND